MNPLGTGQRTDVSRVMTELPLIAGGDDVALTDAQAQALKQAENFFDELLKDPTFNTPVGAANRIKDAVAKVEAGSTTGLTVSQGDGRYAKEVHAHNIKGTTTV